MAAYLRKIISADAEGKLKPTPQNYDNFYDYLYEEIEELEDRYLKIDKRLQYADNCRDNEDFDLVKWAYKAYVNVFYETRNIPEDKDYFDRALSGLNSLRMTDNEMIAEFVNDFLFYYHMEEEEKRRKKQQNQ